MHPKDRPIIVLSTGRAGSTLLQKLLNTHKGVVIWGEHAGILNQLMNASRVVSKSEWIPDQEPRGNWLLQKERPVNADRWTAWDGSFSKEGFYKYLKNFTDNLFCKDIPEGVRWGFKEIRYCNIDLMKFISELYPNAQFILLLRNPIDSCVSFTSALASKESKTSDEFSSTMRNIVDKRINPVFHFFRQATELYPEKTRVVLFEQLVESTCEVLDGISSFLELSSGFDDDSILQIMNKDIVSERRRTSKNQQDMLKNMALPLLEKQLEWYERIIFENNLHVSTKLTTLSNIEKPQQ